MITIFNLKIDIPFETKRVFMLSEVPIETERGGHGHKSCQQYIISLNGIWEIKLFSAKSRLIVQLDKDSGGILIPIGTYITMKPLEVASVLCVFASNEYDPEDYFYDIPDLVM
jgi:hypothetical protein